MVTLSRIVGDSSCEGEKGGDVGGVDDWDSEDDGDCGDEDVVGDSVGSEGEFEGDPVGGDGEVEGDKFGGDGEVEGGDVGGDGEVEVEGEDESESGGELSDISWSFLLLKLPFSSLLFWSAEGIVPLVSPNM